MKQQAKLVSSYVQVAVPFISFKDGYEVFSESKHAHAAMHPKGIYQQGIYRYEAIFQ